MRLSHTIDIDAGITADHLNEGEITRTILRSSAKRKIALVVSEKINKISFIKVAPAEILDEIITDKNIIDNAHNKITVNRSE